MARPGVTVTTSSAVASSATPGERLGTYFVAAQTQRGPLVPDPTTPLRALADYTALYGTRATTVGSAATTYDALEAFWRTGGGPVLLARVAGPDAAVATLTLVDRVTPTAGDTLRVDAIGPGDWYDDHIKISVANGAVAGTFVITVLVDNVATEVSPELSSPADAAAWATTSAYVRITDLASTGTAPDNNPAVLAATALAGGDDDLDAVTDTHWTAALTTLRAEWGPGLTSKIGVVSSAGHAGTMAHAAANNRLAILDGASASAASTLASLAATVAESATAPEYGMLAAPWLRIPAPAGSVTPRLIAPSAVVAGLISRQVTSGSAAVPAAGANGAAPWVSDVQTVFTAAELDSLNATRAVNVLRRPYAASANPDVVLYGYNTLGLAAGGWRQAGSQLLRLRLVDELTVIGEQFVFDLIDGRGQKLAEYEAALTAVLAEHYAAGELYGATAEDAYVVDVASPNTAETLAAGELHARIGIRVSPMGEFVFITVSKSPVDQTLNA